MAADVLLIHGLWMRSVAMRWLAARLRGQGFTAHEFGYYSLLQDTDAVVARLAETLALRPGAHVVAHSLGGLLALRAVERLQPGRVGRIVCLGTPLAGSRAADAVVAQVPAGAWLVGSSRDLLRAGIEQVPAGTEVGMIAGCVPRGLGGLLARFDGEHDGTVAVAETRVPALAAHVVVPASHSGLLFSAAAAAQAACFLQSGRFGTTAGAHGEIDNRV